ncbi:hypothetical protein LEMLEM_LOCUS2767 [Lemmus lemmus]
MQFFKFKINAQKIQNGARYVCVGRMGLGMYVCVG